MSEYEEGSYEKRVAFLSELNALVAEFYGESHPDSRDYRDARGGLIWHYIQLMYATCEVESTPELTTRLATLITLVVAKELWGEEYLQILQTRIAADQTDLDNAAQKETSLILTDILRPRHVSLDPGDN